MVLKFDQSQSETASEFRAANRSVPYEAMAARCGPRARRLRPVSVVREGECRLALRSALLPDEAAVTARPWYGGALLNDEPRIALRSFVGGRVQTQKDGEELQNQAGIAE
jgi:hypothetical protein